MGVSTTVSLLFEMESLPMALSSDGPRVSLLQQVVTPLRLGLLPASLRDCVLCELLGGFHMKWSPFWKQLRAVIESMAAVDVEACWKWMERSALFASGYCDVAGIPYEQTMELEARDDDQHQEEEKEEERFVSRRAVAERYGVWRTPPSEKQDPVEDIAFE